MNYESLFINNFKEVNGLLDILARRNNKDCVTWCDYTKEVPHQVICFICNNKFDEIEETVWNHGYLHLKEKNLLPLL